MICVSLSKLLHQGLKSFRSVVGIIQIFFILSREWEPIDWGFNPFDVEDWVNQTLLDHVVKANISLATAEGRRGG